MTAHLPSTRLSNDSVKLLRYIAVIGGANMDISAQTSVALATADSTEGHIHCFPGGVARNVAENLARLGHITRLVSAVGEDVFGRHLLDATRAAGVDVTAFSVLPSQRTASYLSLHGPDGDMAVAVNDMALFECLTPEVLRNFTGVFDAAACTVVDCNLTPVALEWLMAHASMTTFFADGVSVVKCKRIAPWLGRIHTLKVNRLEAQALSGQTAMSAPEACLAAAYLHQLGVLNVVVSLGEQGVCWCDAQGVTGHRPARRVSVVNTTGAGDALLAGLVHAFVRGMPLSQSVEFAMACAELTLASKFANDPLLSVTTVQKLLSASSLQF